MQELSFLKVYPSTTNAAFSSRSRGLATIEASRSGIRMGVASRIGHRVGGCTNFQRNWVDMS